RDPLTRAVVTVSPGVAMDCDGRLLVLRQPLRQAVWPLLGPADRESAVEWRRTGEVDAELVAERADAEEELEPDGVVEAEVEVDEVFVVEEVRRRPRLYVSLVFCEKA